MFTFIVFSPVCSLVWYFPVCLLLLYFPLGVHFYGIFPAMSGAGSCNCTEPCTRRLYESQLSNAEFSSLSVEQILSSDLEELQEKYVSTLELNQRTSPNTFINDVKMIKGIVSSYDEIMEFFRRHIWLNYASVLFKVESSLQALIRQIIRADLQESNPGKIKSYAAAFYENYGLLRKTVVSYGDMFILNLEVLLRQLDGVIAHNSGISFLVEQIDKTSNDLNIYNDALNVYFESLGSEKSVYSSPQMALRPESKALLPETINSPDRPDGCRASVSRLLHDVIPELGNSLTLLKRTLIQNGSLSSDGILDGVQLVHLSQLTSLSVEPLSKSVESCANEYYTFLQNVTSWSDSLVLELDYLVAKMSLFSSSDTVDDRLDFIEETQSLKEDRNSFDQNYKLLLSGRMDTMGIAKLFQEAHVSTAEQSIDTLVSRIKFRLMEPLQKTMDRVRATATEAYVSLLENELSLSTYLGTKYNDASLKEFRLWYRPKANFHTPMFPEMAKDRFLFENTPKFVRSQARKVVNELFAWYSLPLQEAMDWVDAEVRRRQEGLKGKLRHAQSRYEDFRERTILDAAFIK